MGLVLLLLGHDRSLDRLSKLIVAVQGPVAAGPHWFSPNPWVLGALPFLVGLMGWMPCPLDLASRSSLWIHARQNDSGHRASRAEAEADFNLGYAITVVMAVLFLLLGAVSHAS